ncbi:MAG: hypothetical protein ACXVXO_00765 [Mycobacteriaceae bacterium]
MTLADALTASRATLAGSCPLATIRDGLGAADTATLDAALAGTDPAVAIASALTAAGSRIAENDVRNHRVGDCPCTIVTGA